MAASAEWITLKSVQVADGIVVERATGPAELVRIVKFGKPMAFKVDVAEAICEGILAMITVKAPAKASTKKAAAPKVNAEETTGILAALRGLSDEKLLELLAGQ